MRPPYEAHKGAPRGASVTAWLFSIALVALSTGLLSSPLFAWARILASARDGGA